MKKCIIKIIKLKLDPDQKTNKIINSYLVFKKHQYLERANLGIHLKE